MAELPPFGPGSCRAPRNPTTYIYTIWCLMGTFEFVGLSGPSRDTGLAMETNPTALSLRPRRHTNAKKPHGVMRVHSPLGVASCRGNRGALICRHVTKPQIHLQYGVLMSRKYKKTKRRCHHYLHRHELRHGGPGARGGSIVIIREYSTQREAPVSRERKTKEKI